MGSYCALKGHSAASQGWSSWSSPLRSDDSSDDQAGEAGPVEHSLAEAKSLKLKAKGLSVPPQWLTTEAARREGQRAKLGTTLTTIYKRTQSLKRLWLEA